jgi:tetrahydromethanopterin S-methyltransferase subunit G
MLSCVVLPIFAQNDTFDEQFVSSEEYSKIMDRLHELENQPTFDEQFVSSEEYSKIMDRLHELENQPTFDEQLTSNAGYVDILDKLSDIETKIIQLSSQPLSILGLFIQMIGFVLMLRYWSDPYERHLENWIKWTKLIHPNSYEERIKRNFNYWRNYRNIKEESPDGDAWMIPLEFAVFWKRMKNTAFFSVIGGLFLQIIQILIL